MRLLILTFALTLSLLAPRSEAQQADIQGVISSQIEAFKLDDFATAFTFAAPNIQGIFQTPENFGRMVSRGYPMVWRPSAVEYLELREINGFTFQDVRVTDAQGRVFLLEYSMMEISGGWKIAGVRILEQSELSA